MADEEYTPMTDQRLAGIAGRARQSPYSWVRDDIATLLAEVSRARAALDKEQREHGNCEDANFRYSMAQTEAMVALAEQNKAMREIVEVIAQCGGVLVPDVQWAARKARALLAKNPA